MSIVAIPCKRRQEMVSVPKYCTVEAFPATTLVSDQLLLRPALLTLFELLN